MLAGKVIARELLPPCGEVVLETIHHLGRESVERVEDDGLQAGIGPKAPFDFEDRVRDLLAPVEWDEQSPGNEPPGRSDVWSHEDKRLGCGPKNLKSGAPRWSRSGGERPSTQDSPEDMSGLQCSEKLIDDLTLVFVDVHSVRVSDGGWFP